MGVWATGGFAPSGAFVRAPADCRLLRSASPSLDHLLLLLARFTSSPSSVLRKSFRKREREREWGMVPGGPLDDSRFLFSGFRAYGGLRVDGHGSDFGLIETFCSPPAHCKQSKKEEKNLPRTRNKNWHIKWQQLCLKLPFVVPQIAGESGLEWSVALPAGVDRFCLADSLANPSSAGLDCNLVPDGQCTGRQFPKSAAPGYRSAL